MSSRTRDEVQRLLKLADHATTPESIRRRLPELHAAAVTSPPRAKEKFIALARDELPLLPTEAPTAALYRVQTLETYLRHCARPEFRDLDPETIHRQLEQVSDPDVFLTDALDRDKIVFPWDHSWLVQAGPHIIQQSGAQLIRSLELGHQRPPLVLCVLSLERLVAAGVRIRKPTAADAALGEHQYWSGQDVPAGDEFVDLDVHGEAVEECLWRP